MNNRRERVDEKSTPMVSSIELDLLATLFDQAPDVAFFVKDAEGRYVAVNASLLNRHGFKETGRGHWKAAK